MAKEKRKYQDDLILLNIELAKVKDFDLLMEKILKSVREFVDCDAGSIYIRTEKGLEFRYTQNDTLQKLEPNRKLIYKTFTLPVTNTSIAGYVFLTGESVNTPDAYGMPPEVSYCFDKSFDRISSYTTHSLLTVPLKAASGDNIGVLQLINARDDQGNFIPFDPDFELCVNYFANSAANALERALLTRTIILRLVKITELRDPKETGNHVHRVGGYAVEIYETWAKKRGIPQEEIIHNRDILHMAAMMHDVGKAAVSDKILKKPGKLTSEEYEVMKQHTVLGGRLLENPSTEYEKAAQIVALNHHERWDGKGYPGHVDVATGEVTEGKAVGMGGVCPKKGEEIPLFGRIVAIADVYDALSFQRVYKDAWEQEDVLSLIWEERGRHFDPEITDCFMESLLMIRSIADRYPSETD